MRRRTWLGLGVAAGVLVATGGALVATWRPGWSQGRLTPSGRALFGALAQAVLADLLPADAAQRQAAIAAHLGRLEAVVGGMHPLTRKEVDQLTTLLAHPVGRRALAGLAPDWPDASVAELQQMLQALRSSDQATRQQIYHALRDLTAAAYFGDRSTWAAIGYPGPTPL